MARAPALPLARFPSRGPASVAAGLATCLALGSAPLSAQQPVPASGTQVGTIEAVIDGDERTFDVYEGPLDDGFATGYVDRGNPDVVYVSLLGFDRESDDRLMVHVVVDIADGTHVCVPLDNRVVFYPAGSTDETGLRLQAGPGTSSETCPVRPGSLTGVAANLNVRQVVLHDDGTLEVAGDFSGELGRRGRTHDSRGTYQARVSRFEISGTGR